MNKANDNSGDNHQARPKGFATRAIHAFQSADQWDSMAVVVPMVASTTFKQYGPADFKKYEYSRSGNPNRDVLENCLAQLENGKYGLCFASGLGAITAIFGMFSSGDHIIIGDDIYGGTNRLFSKVLTKFQLEISFVCTLDPDAVQAQIRQSTKMVWLESPSNPTLKVADIARIAVLIKQRNENVLLAVDNTFLTPYFQRPLELGADLSVHSVSKYLNGHSDVIMGAIVTNSECIYNQLRFLQNAMGIVPAPFDCYQVTRSLKTLALRMQQHSKSALEVGTFLERHQKVLKVLHPGLLSHPQYELSKRQTSGHSGVFSFYIKGGLEEAQRFLQALRVFTLAESLGGYESLAELPSVMTHSSVPEDQRQHLNITHNLIRLSVGLEDVEDLIDDLQQAFNSTEILN